MPTFGPTELIIILVIVTMLFGVGKLPEVFGAVGKGIREFRKESTVTTDKQTTITTDPTSETKVVETTVVERS
ncbi:MAG: twin-arginine translocase TatA/TatE family subunit [Chloroflexota bacterium]|nr:twin-arginine translocase TatA/TatE family subunit [Chloroflexota bacterium]